MSIWYTFSNILLLICFLNLKRISCRKHIILLFSPQFTLSLLTGFFRSFVFSLMGFTGDSAGINPHAMQETQVQSLGREDPLAMEMATFQDSC